jgi:hypothetical protein
MAHYRHDRLASISMKRDAFGMYFRIGILGFVLERI